RLWGACLFVPVTDLEVASFTFTQVQKAVDLKVLQMEDDLVISFHLMVCVLEFFIRRCPPSLLQTPNPSTYKVEIKFTLLGILCLGFLCLSSHWSSVVLVFQVKNVYQTSFSAFLDSMGLSGTQGLPQVRCTHCIKCWSLLLLQSLSPCFIYISVVSLSSTIVFIMHFHPYLHRSAMNSIAQLRVDLTSSGDQPSATLALYFKNCKVDPTEKVLQRVERLGQLFSQMFGHAVEPRCVGLGKWRFTLGVRLYYRVMVSMLKSVNDLVLFRKLLNECTFHTSLLACALEVIMATYGSSLMNGGYNNCGSIPVETDLFFLWILDVFQLTAFDFYKVIESFIKAEPSRSKDIVKHLELCEHLIMETIAWRRLLKQTRKEGPVEQAEPPAILNQTLQHTCKSPQGQYVSIIVSYNLVFMQELKTNILQYASPRVRQTVSAPMCSPTPPMRVHGSNNVYISPMKSPSRMSPGVMTPRTRILVSIGESFGVRDHFHPHLISSRRLILRFDIDGQDEADGSKPDGDSTVIQKLAEINLTIGFGWDSDLDSLLATAEQSIISS
uniref:Retinoblastoma 1 n=1 Tax=Hucho hucho TaxID=62062 RepID=A0A4W5P1C2_9TELE